MGLLSVAGTEHTTNVSPFTQTGGTNTAGSFSLGGAYMLSGPSVLSTPGVEDVYGSFSQSGGVNRPVSLVIHGEGQFTVGNTTWGFWGEYLLSGGTLQVGDGGLVNYGIFDGRNSPGTLVSGGVVDLTQGTWQNLGPQRLR